LKKDSEEEEGRLRYFLVGVLVVEVHLLLRGLVIGQLWRLTQLTEIVGDEFAWNVFLDHVFFVDVEAKDHCWLTSALKNIRNADVPSCKFP